MDIFEHESQYKVHLCEHTDEPIFICFQEVLKQELGAWQLDHWRGLEISCATFLVREEIITVHAETYIGIEIFGPPPIVDDIMERVRRKM